MLALVLGVCSGVVYAQTTELRFVTWKPEAPEVWDQAIADFERQNPGRQSHPRYRAAVFDPTPRSAHAKAEEPRHGSGRVCHGRHLARRIRLGGLGSCRWTVISPRAEQKQFLDAPIAANRYRGQIFGVPLFIDAGLLYYRKDLLEKYRIAPPRTWPELVDAGQNDSRRREQDPQLVGFSGQFKQYEGLICNMMEYILSNGGTLWDESRHDQRSRTSRRRVAAVRFVRDRIIGEISHRGVLAYEEPESLALFTEGKGDLSSQLALRLEQLPTTPQRSKVAGKVGMMPLPGFSPAARARPRSAVGRSAISRFSRQPELAWRFVAFMTGANMQKRIALATGRAPTRAALYDDPEVDERRCRN